jgi:Fe-S oxidoreductase, related to NifB/MoaA family
MKKTRHIIKTVESDSIAYELELMPGDELLTINDNVIKDVFDYHFLVNDEYLEILIRKSDGEEWTLEIEKEYQEELGIVFENEFMDEYRSCQNKCIFCFVDQMPKGMRDTLYFKDDDSRLSFLQGNYITMTNVKDEDLERIIKYHLSPINISFHTTNPKLRCQMLNNRFAGDVFAKVQRLYEAGIEMNGQIVLCKGVNDGEELERSINDLQEYLPLLKSLSVVPVGLTKFRAGLYPLASFTSEDALAVLTIIHRWQQQLLAKKQSRFVYGSDEWYVLAKLPIPSEDDYEEYPQLENGVGMLRVLETEITTAIKARTGDVRKHKISIATGKLAYQFIAKYITMIKAKYPNVEVAVYAIENQFFGKEITVSGLLTGRDIISQLKDKKLGECLLLPVNMLRAGEQTFLDDITVTAVSDALQIPIRIVETHGADLVANVLLESTNLEHKRRQIYEQTNSSSCRTT